MKPTRKVLPVFLLLAGLPAQEALVDTYWQRESGAKVYDELTPFRNPTGLKVPGAPQVKLPPIVEEFVIMFNLAVSARSEDLVVDESGRQIYADPRWAASLEKVLELSIRMEGWVGKLFMESDNVLWRRVCAYGMFYFNNPQDVINMIAFLPGEPRRDIREDSFWRVVEYLAIHLPQNRPQNPLTPNNGVVVPLYQFNPMPFMQLLDKPEELDQAQALWFLAEVLSFRPDLGKSYLSEIVDRVPALLTSSSAMVRSRALDFLAAIDRTPGRAPEPSATDEERLAWLGQLEYELYPPIRHISSGLVEIYPSADRERLVTVGRQWLDDKDFLPKATEVTKSGMTRYGVRVNHLPDPLDKLGIPMGALIMGINRAPTRTAEEFHKRITDGVEAHKKAEQEYEKYLREFLRTQKSASEQPRPRTVPGFQVEYIHKGSTYVKDFLLKQ